MENLEENCYDANKRQLNLSHRNLRSLNSTIIASYGNCTEYLDLSHNRIDNLSWLYEFSQLKCLIMDDNRLREAHFDRLKWPMANIHTLILNENELSDLKTTASLLQKIFPNVKYLSLHGNAMCPDNLLLQPFCEFVPYEYNHYRTVLLKSLPNLKFLDHFSLDSLHLQSSDITTQNDQEVQQQHQHHQQQLLTSTPKDLWSKLKNFLTVNSNQSNAVTTIIPTMSYNNYASSSSLYNTPYRGINSEGNRYITNSDL